MVEVFGAVELNVPGSDCKEVVAADCAEVDPRGAEVVGLDAVEEVGQVETGADHL